MENIVLVWGKKISKTLQILGLLNFFFLTLEQFFLTVRWNNYGNKIPYLMRHFRPWKRKVWKIFLEKHNQFKTIVAGKVFSLKFDKFSLLNQTTYVLEFWLLEQSFWNRDSFLSRSFLNWDLSLCCENWKNRKKSHTIS